MTVAELIAELQDFDPNAEVCIEDSYSNETRPLTHVMRTGKSARDRATHKPLLVYEEPA